MLRGPAGMKNVVGLLWDGLKLGRISAGVCSNFYGAPAPTKIVFKLLKDVCSDFTDTNCTVISIVLLSVN